MPGQLRSKPDSEPFLGAEIIAFVPRVRADHDPRTLPQPASKDDGSQPPAPHARDVQPLHLADRAQDTRTQGVPTQGAANAGTRNLAAFEHIDPAPDNYRHRMIANGAGFAAALLLILAGIWLADKIAELRHDQDCVLMRLQTCSLAAAPLHSRQP